MTFFFLWSPNLSVAFETPASSVALPLIFDFLPSLTGLIFFSFALGLVSFGGGFDAGGSSSE